MKDFRAIVIGFFSNYFLILLISLMLIFAVYITESHNRVQSLKTVRSEPRVCSFHEHLILRPSGVSELLTTIPSKALNMGVSKILTPVITLDELISLQRHTSFILNSIIKELKTGKSESEFIYDEEELIVNAIQRRELLHWLQRRTAIALGVIDKPMHQMDKAFWRLIYVEAAAAQLLVVARDLNVFEAYGLCLLRECCLLDGMRKAFNEDFLLQAEKMQSLAAPQMKLFGANVLLAKPVKRSLCVENIKERGKVIGACERLRGAFVKINEEIEGKSFNDATKWRLAKRRVK